MVFKSDYIRIIVRFMFGGLEKFFGIYFRDDYFVNHCKAFCDLPFFCLKKMVTSVSRLKAKFNVFRGP